MYKFQKFKKYLGLTIMFLGIIFVVGLTEVRATEQIELPKVSIGIVVAAKGMNTIIDKEGESISVGIPQDVYEGDSIFTEKRGFVIVQLSDGSKITVRPNSRVEITAYQYDSTDNDSVELSLVSGGLRIVTGALAKTHPDNYMLKTPVALMGVRGTEFSVFLCGENICEVEQIGYDEPSN